MARVAFIVGLVAAGAGGYLLGRRSDEDWPGLVRELWRRGSVGGQEGPPRRQWRDETEYGRLAEREAAERHRIAEEIKHRPLRAPSEDRDEVDVTRLTTPPGRQPPGDIIGPHPV